MKSQLHELFLLGGTQIQFQCLGRCLRKKKKKVLIKKAGWGAIPQAPILLVHLLWEYITGTNVLRGVEVGCRKLWSHERVRRLFTGSPVSAHKDTRHGKQSRLQTKQGELASVTLNNFEVFASATKSNSSIFSHPEKRRQFIIGIGILAEPTNLDPRFGNVDAVCKKSTSNSLFGSFAH